MSSLRLDKSTIVVQNLNGALPLSGQALPHQLNQGIPIAIGTRYNIPVFIVFILSFFILSLSSTAQRGGVKWWKDGISYTSNKEGNIIKTDVKTGVETVLISKEQLTPAGGKTLKADDFKFSSDNSKVLIFTNTARVWRYNTKGDYWLYDFTTKQLKQLGKGRPAQSLMFAKISPDNSRVAFVSENNIYTENLTTGNIIKHTMDGTRKLINGTFDWVYEEEFGCRDGFRWSPDGSKIAFWQVDANKIRDYYMINTTDSNYSKIIPVEYPKVGEAPSPVRIGVFNLSGGAIRWMQIDGDPQQHYIPRMEWANNNELVIQQLDRKQQESKLKYCNVQDGSSYTFWAEDDDAWVDLNTSDPTGWSWINKGNDFIWVSEKDGWRHIYKISKDGKTETLLTKGNYDIGDIKCIDEANNVIYFTASPENATELYLYRVKIDPSKTSYLNINKPKAKTESRIDAELVTPAGFKGTHRYEISPIGKFARHSFSNHNTPPVTEWISLPDNKPVNAAKAIAANVKKDDKINVEYTTILLDNGYVLDAWINKPANFNAAKKYPVVMYVYGEPAASVVGNSYGAHRNFLFDGDMSQEGYVQVAIDNRGTPSLKGAPWRKSIYRKIGKINIDDLAEGFKKLMEKNSYFDKTRTAVWGWSGGGSCTLNMMFRYPDLFQTGVAIAAVANQLNYDNIYQERYMGIPQENRQDFIDGSPITYAKGLKGNLLYIHGTGDDNVHYSNAEQLLNELIKHNKQFQFMAYPNRTHNINEGEGTEQHLSTLYTNFIRKNCPAGGK